MRRYTSRGGAQEEAGTTLRIPDIWHDAKEQAIDGIQNSVKQDLVGETPVRGVGTWNIQGQSNLLVGVL